MTDGVVQTLWAELVVATLAEAGVTTCVVSPGSRSTPLVAALASDGRLELPTIIDERAAAFYALGLARATGSPVALVCTSGSAAAHYLPAIVEASEAGVPLIAITADRPPELQHCGAAQTIDQIGIYGGFVRAAFDLGPPHGSELALRAVRRTIVQAITASRGPLPGPVHVNVPLRKPLEPARPTTSDERALAAIVYDRIVIAPPRLTADRTAVAQLAAAIAAEPNGIVIAGAMTAARLDVLALCAKAGYPLLAESGSQLRFVARPGVTAIDHLDFVLAARLAPAPKLILQLGAEPVAAGWPAAKAAFAHAQRWVLADRWRDPDGGATVIVGEVELANLVEPRGDSDFTRAWREAEARAAAAVEQTLVEHASSEAATIRSALAAMPSGATVQIGNSLPIRVVDQVASGGPHVTVLTQRGAAGIDGLIASATGASRAGAPVLLILGDVSFAHDLGSLLVARTATRPLAILVVDNGGGRIFGGLPIASSGGREMFEAHFVTRPEIDVLAVAAALHLRAVSATTPTAVARCVATALAEPGTTIIHAPVAETGAREVRAAVLAHLTGARHG
ncbi:MAG: 2-succinyl-5-enolpyruvyl-6-hydroxy-3-cyclohexene-1-carboxylic-acid synthase [Kofleriaceae bacterium]